MHSPFMSLVGRVVILCSCVLCFLESTKLCIYVQPRSCAQVWVVPWVGLFPLCVSLTPCSMGGKSSVPAERSQQPHWRENCTREVVWVCASQNWSPGDREHWWNWVLALPAGVAHIWEWLLLIQGSVERQWRPSLCTVSVFSKATALSFLSSSW